MVDYVYMRFFPQTNSFSRRNGERRFTCSENISVCIHCDTILHSGHIFWLLSALVHCMKEYKKWSYMNLNPINFFHYKMLKNVHILCSLNTILYTGNNGILAYFWYFFTLYNVSFSPHFFIYLYNIFLGFYTFNATFSPDTNI